MVSMLKSGATDSRVLFINAVMETTQKYQKPTTDWLWDAAAAKGMQFPKINDGDPKLRKFFGCSSLPMNMAVDLTNMKILYSKCGYSKTAIESFIKSHFGY